MSNDLLTQRYTELDEASRNARAYLVYMMGSKKPVPVDADELSKIQQAIAAGGSCWVRQGNFNARGYSHIVEDTERVQEYHREIEKRSEQLRHNVDYNNMAIEEALALATVPRLKLKNIFAGVELSTLPANQNALHE